MGSQLSMLRKELDSSREQFAISEEEKLKTQERLNVLEKMVNYHLDSAINSMLNGKRGDQQIHSGTVVECTKQMNVQLSVKESDKLEDAIDKFFGGEVKEGFKSLVTGATDAVLGNTSMGEHEGENMFIQWSDNALLRLDAYYYRWNFSSHEIIQNVEGVIGVVVMKRVIDLTKTDPQVLTWAISRQAKKTSVNEEEATEMIDEAVTIIKKVSSLQEVLKSMQTEDENKEKGKHDSD